MTEADTGPGPERVGISRPFPLPLRDPFDGGELEVTRIRNPRTGVVIEGRFELGWIGRLSRDQLDFVGLLVKHRANVQRLAGEVGIGYNTARSRLDDIARALDTDQTELSEGRPGGVEDVLDRLEAGQLTPSEAELALRRRRRA